MEQHEAPVSPKLPTRRKFLITTTASVSMLALSACGGGGREGSAAAEAMLDNGEGIKTAERGRKNWKRDTTAPTAPTGMSATALSSSSIEVVWGAATDNVKMSHYLLYRCDGNACTPSRQIATVTSTSYTDSGLAGGAPYSYMVVAVDSAGNVSAPSSTATATTFAAAVAPSVDTTAPSVPTELSATATSSSSISLKWNAATDSVGVAGYIVYRCVGNGCSGLTEVSRTTGTSYTDSALDGGTTYSYSVAAIDAAGNASAPSLAALATTFAPAPAPTPAPAPAPTGSAALTWNAVSATDLAGYRVYYGTTPGSYVQARGSGISVANTALPSYTVGGLQSGITYYFAVTSYDLSGNESAYSSEVAKTIN